MLSGFFDDAQEDESLLKKKKIPEKKSNQSKKESRPDYPPKNKEHLYKSNDKSKNYPKKKEESRKESFKPRPIGKPLKSKYPSPPRPPYPAKKSTNNAKTSNQTKDSQSFDQKSSNLSQNFIMDQLLVYQKNIIDNISNFRSESIKQIDLMINEIDRINYSKYNSL